MPTNAQFTELPSTDLSFVTGGAGSKADWKQIQQQASQYCPVTAAKYANIDPSTITRGKAQQMGASCVAEINPFIRGIAKGKINDAINQAFPTK